MWLGPLESPPTYLVHHPLVSDVVVVLDGVVLLTIHAQGLPCGIHFRARGPTVYVFLHKGPVEPDQLIGEVKLTKEGRWMA